MSGTRTAVCKWCGRTFRTASGNHSANCCGREWCLRARREAKLEKQRAYNLARGHSGRRQDGQDACARGESTTGSVWCAQWAFANDLPRIRRMQGGGMR